MDLSKWTDGNIQGLLNAEEEIQESRRTRCSTIMMQVSCLSVKVMVPDIEEIINKLRNSMASGTNELHAKLFKNGGPELAKGVPRVHCTNLGRTGYFNRMDNRMNCVHIYVRGKEIL